ncbi:DinB family protein [Geojedonia litorea]|uniref:DinB family protein n=1 Tax=Geojedonia litorea TaxID=1268269 RepID=A0ABV9MZR6_9FLAO
MSLQNLFNQIENARSQFLKECEGLSISQSHFKPSPKVWSITDNTEHLYWAEFGGINGMWKAIEGKKTNNPVWTKAAIHEGLSIEDIVDLTWKPKEDVPLGAEPRIGGSLEFWTTSLKSCSVLLKDLYVELKTHEHLEEIIYPHPISGPLNVIQRFEFLRFHIDRHSEQVRNLKKHHDFPNA